MIKNSTYKLLDTPLLYKLSQLIFAPGAEIKIVFELKNLSKKYDTSKNIIDVGCGPSSWLWKINALPTGLDVSHQYSIAYSSHKAISITGSATMLPFVDASFNGIWSIGLLHHLPDNLAKMAINEMVRICAPGGYVLIMDAVLPKKNILRPFAALIRRLDRGKFMRSQEHLQSLLPNPFNWHTRRYTYALTGLEMLECAYKKS